MTLPSGGTITMQQIGAEFAPVVGGPPYSLSMYRGVRWYQDNTLTGFFPTGTISMSDFYGKRYNTPVVASSTVFFSSGNFGVPLYSVLTVVVRGGGGGGGGGGARGTGPTGNTEVVNAGGTGGSGNGSYFWTPSFSAPGGGGGGGGSMIFVNNTWIPFTGGNGAAGANSDGAPGGGGGGGGFNGGGSGGSGGAGGRNVYQFFNPISGGSGPAVGSTVFVSVGGGGGGGGSAGGYFYFLGWPSFGNSSPGNPGGNGYVEIYWS